MKGLVLQTSLVLDRRPPKGDLPYLMFLLLLAGVV